MSNIFVDIWDINNKAINPAAAIKYVTTSRNGAETIFIGTVRDHNLGRKVVGVSYDVFETLAIKTIKTICAEAQQQWGQDLDIYVVHAKGKLNIGEISIIISIGSPHRDEAFQACRYIIEQIKHKAPIWKLEHYVDGDSEWSKGCELCSK